MAGGNLFNSNFKKPTNEVLFENQSEHVQHQPEYRADEYFRKYFAEYKHQEKVLFSHEEQEKEQELSQLRTQVLNLKNSTPEVPIELEKAVEQNVAEVSEYQITFFSKARQTFITFKEDPSRVDAWQEQFGLRSKNKGQYFKNVNNKHGGGKAKDSAESVASRSAN